MILVIVYVGAVAVLFLFVVMMLDIDFAELRGGFMRYLPIGALIGAHPAGRAGAGHRQPGSSRPGGAGRRCGRVAAPAEVSNTRGARRACSIPTISSCSRPPGLILLVAMIGAIVLTLRQRDRRAPAVDRRAGRPPPRARPVEVVKVVPTGSGI